MSDQVRNQNVGFLMTRLKYQRVTTRFAKQMRFVAVVEPCHEKNLFYGCPTGSITMPQKMTSGLKFLVKKVEGLYNHCSENKSAKQLYGYRTADLGLCFCIVEKQVFSLCGSDNGR